MINKTGPYCFYIKSTEDKPTPQEYPGIFNDNVVLVYELDTGNAYYYDTENETWATLALNESSSNSGGLNGGSNPNPNLSEAENATLDLMEAGIIEPLTDNEGNVLVDSNNTIYTE